MKGYLFILLLCCIGGQDAYSQIYLNEDQAVAQVMAIYAIKANENSQIDGWRIQIINTDDRRQMEAAKTKFSAQYPDIKMTWEHVQPYYQVKIGAYKDKLSLEPFLRELKDDFPRSIPVRVKLDKLELLQ